jgi:transcriptional regulator with XRE-family HTH domain
MQRVLDGIDDLGVLCKNIRESRHLEAKDLARLAGIDAGSISRFERNAHISIDAFSSYLNGLGLNSNERDILLYNLFYPSRKQQLKESVEKLSRVRFSIIADKKNSVSRSALESLRIAEYPAYIRDEIGFIHAFNQPILDLFGITLADLTGNWAAWHLISTKYIPGSKLALAHGKQAETYFPRALKQFFEVTARYFFTPHMEALRNRLWNLSEDYRLWWSKITEFGVPFKQLRHLQREILYKGTWISLGLIDEDVFEINLGDLYQGNYTRVGWIPRDPQAWEVMRKIAGPGLKELHLAVDHVQDYNDWDELLK